MTKQLFFEDVDVGTEIPLLVKRPTSQQLVKWAGASEDFYQIHYDKDFALKKDLPGTIIHGRLKAAFMGQLITDWIGERGVLKRFSCLYRGMDLPEVDLTCRGKVKAKYTEGGQNFIECDLVIENANGEKTTTGSAIATLPSRQ